MNKVIWKYQLEVMDEQYLSLPRGAEILCVQAQERSICMWILLDQSAMYVNRRIKIRGTGHPANTESKAGYIGTVQMDVPYSRDGLVWHLFDGGES